MAAALRLFSQRGYDGTSPQDIADELGLTKAAVYYHYNTKAEVLHAVRAPLEKTMTDVIASAAHLRTRREKIDVLANGFADAMISQREVMRVVNDPVMNEQMKVRRKVPRLDELFEPAVRVLYGDNPTPDQVLAVHAVAGLGDAIAALPSLSDDEVREVLVRAVRRLIPQR